MLSNGALETPKAWITPTRPAVAAEGPPEPRPVTSTLSAWEPAPRTQRALGLCWLPQAWVLKTLGSTLSCLAQSARGPSWRPPTLPRLGETPTRHVPPAMSRTKPHPGLGWRSLVARARTQTFPIPLGPVSLEGSRGEVARRTRGLPIHPHVCLLHPPGPQSQSLLPAPPPAPGGPREVRGAARRRCSWAWGPGSRC